MQASVHCPNSNCQNKKKTGLSSRKYSVGTLTTAQEVTVLTSAALLLHGLMQPPLPSALSSPSPWFSVGHLAIVPNVVGMPLL